MSSSLVNTVSTSMTSTASDDTPGCKFIPDSGVSALAAQRMAVEIVVTRSCHTLHILRSSFAPCLEVLGFDRLQDAAKNRSGLHVDTDHLAHI